MSRVPANADLSTRKRRRDDPHIEEEEDDENDEVFDAPFGMLEKNMSSGVNDQNLAIFLICLFKEWKRKRTMNSNKIVP
jgi:hypothetical protein